MSGIKIGDIVARKSYGCDVFFKVMDIKERNGERILTLKGISYRIEADAPESDLEVQPEMKVREYRDRCWREAENRGGQDVRNEILSLLHAEEQGGEKAHYRDTPNDKAEKIKSRVRYCISTETRITLSTVSLNTKTGDRCGRRIRPRKGPACQGLFAAGEIPARHPVLTGHDGLLKGKDNYNNISSYRTSKYFVEAVKEARRFNPDMDGLVIFAGACQSMYNEIIKAGANFASAPFRDLIHALDPVRVCQKIAFASIDTVLDAEDVINNTITGKTGIGGIQTRGKYREGFPAEPGS